MSGPETQNRYEDESEENQSEGERDSLSAGATTPREMMMAQ
jgi:hypothetical protein